MKKITTILLALIMMVAMSVAVYASDTPANNTNTGAITIEKNLKVTNPTLTSVDGPGASFAYAIAPVAPSAANGGTTITDGTHTATVHQGPANGVALSASSLAFPIGTAVDASASGADNVKSLTATADISKFSAPGIYRYEVTETATLGDCEATNAGTGKRYIDVYVVNGTSGLEFAGLVMHDGTTANGAPAQKTTFDAASFETVNVTLQKTVSGNMADRRHEFPFAGTISDHSRYCYAKENTAPTAVDADKNATGSFNVNLKDTETFYIAGLSKSATVAYTETNDTNDTYSTSITGGTASAASDVAPGNTKAMAATDVDNAGAVVFNNAFDSVSPTGVIMRFGPYLAMIIVAAVLFFMRRKAKK